MIGEGNVSGEKMEGGSSKGEASRESGEGGKSEVNSSRESVDKEGEVVIPSGEPVEEGGESDSGDEDFSPEDFSPIRNCKIPCCTDRSGDNICNQAPTGKSLQGDLNAEYSLMTYYGCEINGCPKALNNCTEYSTNKPVILGFSSNYLFVSSENSNAKRIDIYKLDINSNTKKRPFASLFVSEAISYSILSTYHTERFLFILAKVSLNSGSKLKYLLFVVDTNPKCNYNKRVLRFQLRLDSNKLDTNSKIGITVVEIKEKGNTTPTRFLLLFGTKDNKPVFYRWKFSYFIEFTNRFFRNCISSKKSYFEYKPGTTVKFEFQSKKNSSSISEVISADGGPNYVAIVGKDSNNQNIIELYSFSVRKNGDEFYFTFVKKINSSNRIESLSGNNFLAIRSTSKKSVNSSSLKAIFYLITTDNIYLLTYGSSPGELKLFDPATTNDYYSDFSASFKRCSGNLYAKVESGSVAVDPTTAGYERLFFISKSPSGSNQSIRVLVIKMRKAQSTSSP